MLPPLKAALALLSLLQLGSSRPPMTMSPHLKLSEITQRIQQLNSGAQVNAATPPGFALLTNQGDIINGGDDDDDVPWCFGHPNPFHPRLQVLRA